MGQNRSLPALAKRLNVSHAATKLWSRTFGWAARIEERDKAVAHLVEQKTVKQEVDRRTRNKQIVQAGIVAAARAIAEGRVHPTLADLDRLIRLENFLEGEADSRHELIPVDLRAKTTEELREMLREERRNLASLADEVDAKFEVKEEQEED
jgi:hypothetical protein